MTFPRIFPVVTPHSFLGSGCIGVVVLLEKKGFFVIDPELVEGAGDITGGFHAGFGVHFWGIDGGVLEIGAFGIGFGGVDDFILVGLAPSSESSCSKKSDIEKG
jgi:hypothetical protein